MTNTDVSRVNVSYHNPGFTETKHFSCLCMYEDMYIVLELMTLGRRVLWITYLAAHLNDTTLIEFSKADIVSVPSYYVTCGDSSLTLNASRSKHGHFFHLNNHSPILSRHLWITFFFF